MESPSAPAHRRCVPWQGLLLAASLLTFWSLPSTAQLTIESVPPNAAEGKEVLLRVDNLPGFLGGYVWFKGQSVDSNHQIASYVIDAQEIHPGPAYSQRETIYPNGSLLLKKATLKDTGYYTLLAIKGNFQGEIVTGQLHIYHDPTLPSPGLLDGAIVGIVIGILAGVALIAALVCFLYIRKTRGANDLHGLQEHPPPPATTGQGPTGTSAFLL
ncbi:unnamed protein product, partial [Pipistrellus nathusii]